MNVNIYRKALFALPLAAAAVFATGAGAAPNERTGGRDAGPKMEQNGGGAARGNALGEKSRGENGNKMEGRRGDGDNRGMRAERDGQRDRGIRADRGGRGDKFDAPRRRYSGGQNQNRNWRSGRRYNWGPGVAFYFNDGYYYGQCGWLKRRARETGNPIWLRRFAQCRDAV